MLDFQMFRKEHLESFVPNKGYEGYIEPYADYLELQGKIGQAAAHYANGKIVYLSNFFEVVPGTIEVMIIPSINLPRYIKSVIKDIRDWLNAIMQAKSARRLQTWGDANELIDRWLTCLGFTCEGTLKKYSVEGDKRIWAIWQ